MNIAFLLAAGKSLRFNRDKLFAPLFGKPVIWHSLKFLNSSKHVDAIFVAANKGNKKKIEKLVKAEKFKKVEKVILGGKTRFASLKQLIKSTNHQLQTTNYFIIHNAANPHATQKELYQCINTLKHTRVSGVVGVGVGRPVSSTIKNAPGGRIKQTLPRENLWEMETPQVVRAQEFLKAAHSLGRAAARLLNTAPKGRSLGRAAAKKDFTDDLSVLESAGMETRVILASPNNRKITTKEDLGQKYAVGIGEDSHRFSSPKFKIQNSKNPLILGGVKIPHLPALEAKSDGDVLIHALCNALASAMGKGSLGTYATHMAKKGIRDSKKYLRVIQNEMEKQRQNLRHCSLSIEAARPKIDPHTPRIKKNLSTLLRIPVESIGITATSGEKLTPFGRGEAIRCQAIVSIT